MNVNTVPFNQALNVWAQLHKYNVSWEALHDVEHQKDLEKNNAIANKEIVIWQENSHHQQETPT